MTTSTTLSSTGPTTPVRDHQPDPAAVHVPAVTRKCLADPRCPQPGTRITKMVRAADGEHACTVIVRNDGFERAGRIYSTLTAAATAFMVEMCGGSPRTSRSGFEFFFPEKPVPPNKRKSVRDLPPAVNAVPTQPSSSTTSKTTAWTMPPALKPLED